MVKYDCFKTKDQKGRKVKKSKQESNREMLAFPFFFEAEELRWLQNRANAN